MKKIIISDIDGTLLTTDKKIAESTINIVDEVRKKDIEFTIATGRIYPVVLDMVDEMKITMPLILCNGAIIQDSVSKQIYYSKYIENDIALKILEIAEKSGLYFYYYTDNSINAKQLKYTTQYYYNMNEKTKRKEKIQVNVLDNILEKAKKDVVFKVVVLDEDRRKLDLVREKMQKIEGVDIVSSFYNNIEIVASGVSKGEGVKYFAQKFGYEIKNVMCIGDEENDESMIEMAGFGVAMGNATENMKNMADFVTTSNDEDGMKNAILEFEKR